MARKRRNPTPSPSPPPPPPQQSSSGEESGSDAEVEAEGSPRAGATPMPLQSPQPDPSAAAADDAEEESDQDADAPASPMRPGSKPAAALDSDADEEEDGGSVEADPDVPEPEKAAPTKKAKIATQVKKGSAPGPSGKAKTAAQGKKRPAPDLGPSGKSKKAKAARRVAPEATPTGKSKKAKAEQKGSPGPTASSKAKNPGAKLEESGIPRFHRIWSKHDSILILETLAGHMKKNAEQMDAGDLRAAIGDRLDRKNCSKSELYEKIRSLNRRYNNIVGRGNVPGEQDELRMYQLSDAIWGQEAMETIAAAAVSQKDSSVTKSKKGQASKEKVDGNTKGGTVEEIANCTVDTQKGKEGTCTTTQSGDALVNGKGKTVDKEASTGNQNGCTDTEEENQEDDAEREASVQGTHKSFDVMQKLAQLAGCVERIKAQHLCEEALMMASGFISDEKAKALESAVRTQKKADAETLAQRWKIQAKLIGLLVPLMDDV